MKGIVDFYEKPPETDYAKRHGAGQFYSAPFVYAFDQTLVPRYKPGLAIEKLDVTKFDPEYEEPDTSADTDVDEFLAVAKYKLRRVVILSTPAHRWKAYEKAGGEFYLVAPVYTLWDKYEERYKYPEEFIRRAIEYRYNSVFYLPESEKHGVEEAITRLDQVGAMHASWLVRAPTVRLTHEALALLRNWFCYCVTGMLPGRLKEEIEAFRQLVAEQADRSP